MRRERLKRNGRVLNLPLMKRTQIIALVLGASAIALLARGELHQRDVLLFNATPSVPSGFYVRSEEPVRDGAFVTVRAADVAGPYASLRNFTDDGDRFIKRIAANDGDRVCADGDAIRINDRTVGHRAAQDSHGRALPRWSGCRVLSGGEVFLMGDTPDSFDSRYFGPVSAADIEGVWRPVF